MTVYEVVNSRLFDLKNNLEVKESQLTRFLKENEQIFRKHEKLRSDIANMNRENRKFKEGNG